jgi:elongation factor G
VRRCAPYLGVDFQRERPLAQRVPLKNVRNIGIMAHIDAGKTTLSERILYFTGKVHRMGEVHEGAATMDWMEQERERGITITSAATTCDWMDHQITLIDTPGHVDFTVEVERSLRVLDGAIAVFCGVGGVEPQSETVWRQADKYRVPRIAFINKMDRVGADFFGAVRMMRERLGAHPVPLQVPIMVGDIFHSIIDLVRMVEVTHVEEHGLPTFAEHPIDKDLLEFAEEHRVHMLEALADYNDELLHRYLESHELPFELIQRAIRQGTLEDRITPVLCGSAYKNKGVRHLLDAVIDYLPSPVDVPAVTGENPETLERELRAPDTTEPFSAVVFKIMTDAYAGKLAFFRVYSGRVATGDTVLNTNKGTQERVGRIVKMHANQREECSEMVAGEIGAFVGIRKVSTGDTICAPKHPLILERIVFPEPVLSIAIEPLSKADQDHLAIALDRLSEEDPTFRVRGDEDTGQTLISGMGELHLEILVERMKREFNVGANVGRPEVSYKETITKTAEARGRFIKQSGGRGQYGDVSIRIEPAPGQGFVWENAIIGGAIPREYVAPTEHGVKEAMANGVLAGYPVVDVKVTLLDGSYHEVDSSEMAFKVAGSMAFKEAAGKARPRLLEPLMDVEVVVPESYVGDVMGELNSRRGKVGGMFERGTARVVAAHVPLSEMFGYSTKLRSMTQGRGIYSMQFARFDFVPDALAEEVIKKVKGV